MNKIKTILILFLLCTLISCKKNRTCKCAVTETINGTTNNYDVTYTLKEVSNNQAKNSCFDYETKNQTNGNNAIYDCTLSQ